MKSGWDADAYAEQMKRSTSPVSAFFLIDSLEAIATCTHWLAHLTAYNMPIARRLRGANQRAAASQ